MSQKKQLNLLRKLRQQGRVKKFDGARRAQFLIVDFWSQPARAWRD